MRLRLAVSAAVVGLGLLALAPTAQAAYEQVPEHFGVGGEPEQLFWSRAIAVNIHGTGGVEAGSIYVVGFNRRVLRFSAGSEGEAPQFREAWGWDVGSTAGEFQRCGPAYSAEPRPANAFATCQPGGSAPGGEQVGHFTVLTGVAVDQATGNVYVLNENSDSPNVREHHLIEVFSATGVPIGEGFGDIGREKPFPSEGIAEGPGKLHEQLSSEQDGIAVDDAGTVYVIDHDFTFAPAPQQTRVMSFEPESPGDYEHYVYAGQGRDITAPASNPFSRIALVGSNRLVAASPKLIREYPTGGGKTPVCTFEVKSGQVVGMAANPLNGEVFYFAEGKTSRLHRLGPCNEGTGVFEELQAAWTPSPETESLYGLAVNPSLSWGPLRPAGVLYGVDAEDPTTPKGIGDVFAPAKGAGQTITVSKSGTGAGTVTSSPKGISCGSTCSLAFLEGSTVTLTATPEAGSTFSGWSGECESTSGNECKVKMSAARSVTASFAKEGGGLPEHALSASVSGEGEVKCKLGGGSAGACTSPEPNGTAVEVIATAKFGAQFSQWSATSGSATPCQGSTAITCSFTLSADSSLTAVFVPTVKPKFKLSVSKSGTGSGTVTSTPSGINCGSGANCEAEFEEGAEVTLNQSPAAGSEFKEWTGACAGSGVCKVTMSAAKSVGAVFNLIPRTLSITKAGTGAGEVKCKFNGGTAGACTSPQPNGTAVEVIATANAGSSFAGYSAGTGSAAGCSTSPCAFTIEANSSLTATFNLTAKPKFKLTVSKSGTGSGTVTSTPSGINCGSGANCEAEFEEGAEVTLNQSPAAGSEFKEWSGACSGSGTCKVTMSAAKSVGAVFSPIPRTLSITKAGTGTGEVKCKFNGGTAGACTSPQPNGTAVEVIATANAGSSFAGYSAGTGSASSCSTSPCAFTIEANSSITATFNTTVKPKFKLTVSKSGTGSGIVTSTPSGINCGSGANCEAEFEEGAEVTLNQSPAAGSEFKEWSGACSGSGTCKVTMSAAKSVGAVFSPIPRTLSITKAGTGSGEVKCKLNGGTAGACTSPQPNGTAVEVLATANAGSSFAGYSAGTGSAASCTTSPCSFTIEANSSLTATFNLTAKPKFKLTVSKSGTGSGTVECSPPGGACAHEGEYEEGTEVTLTPAPAAGSEFKEWTGACTGSGTCKVTMSAAKAVSAVFNPIPRTLAIAKAGTGTGEVKCKLNGGSAGACASPVPNGTAVEVLATANPGSTFAGYSAGTGSAASCATSPCSFTLEADSTLTATFNIAVKPKFKLSVTKSGTGAGTVTSTPAAINCGTGAGCEAEFEEGAEVELKETPAAGSEFKEWTGACSGSGSCKVTMSAAKAVGAKFNLIPKPKFKLTVSKLGGGSGTITSTPSGINCGSGAGCEAEFEEGVEVELHETPTTGAFKEWGGACTGSGTCKVAMSAAKSVSARFVKSYELSVEGLGAGSGTIASTPSGISCGSSCEHPYEEGTEVELHATPAPGSAFLKWSGDCSGTGACKVAMSAARSVGAKFVKEFKLTVSKSGAGQGSVSSTPAGIECGSSCEAQYEEGTMVTLAHSAASGSEFKEWSGACTGTGTCKVKMSEAKAVNARFEPVPTPRFSLRIELAGSGSGLVSCDGGACAATYLKGAEVNLNATALSGSAFSGWSGGGCSGTAPCKAKIDADTTIVAHFEASPFVPPPPIEPQGEAIAPSSAVVQAGSASLRLTCPGPGKCAGTLELFAKLPPGAARHKRQSLKSGALIATASFALSPGSSQTLAVKIANAQAKQLLTQGKTLKAQLVGTGVQGRTVKLRGAKHRR